MRLYIITMLVTSISIISSCSNEKPSKVVAEKFLKAYSCGKYDEAKQYGTKRTQQMVNVTSALSKTAPKNQAQAEYEILECDERADKATVKYRLKGSSNSEILHLVKRNETWLVGIGD